MVLDIWTSNKLYWKMIVYILKILVISLLLKTNTLYQNYS